MQSLCIPPTDARSNSPLRQRESSSTLQIATPTRHPTRAAVFETLAGRASATGSTKRVVRGLCISTTKESSPGSSHKAKSLRTCAARVLCPLPGAHRLRPSLGTHVTWTSSSAIKTSSSTPHFAVIGLALSLSFPHNARERARDGSDMATTSGTLCTSLLAFQTQSSTILILRI